LEAKARDAAETLLQLASRSPLIVNAAIFVRDMCRRIIRRSLVSGIRVETNGEELLLKAIAPDASRFIDVGANVGLWSARVLQHGGDRVNVLAFEPSTSALAQLRQRFSHGEPIEIISKAVGEEIHTTEFFEEPGAGEMSSLVAGFSRSASVRQVEVTTIDEELARRSWDSVDFLKVDAEGYDYYVLKGAEKAIAEHKIGVVQFEYNAPWATAGSTLIAAINLFKQHNYQVFLLKADGLHEFSYAKYGEYFAYSNYIGVSPAFLPKLGSYVRGRL
jgi:FkbM family methyltransferase